MIENSDSDKTQKTEKIDIGIYCSVEEVLSKISDSYVVSVLRGNRDHGVRYTENIRLVYNVIFKL